MPNNDIVINDKQAGHYGTTPDGFELIGTIGEAGSRIDRGLLIRNKTTGIFARCCAGVLESVDQKIVTEILKKKGE